MRLSALIDQLLPTECSGCGKPPSVCCADCVPVPKPAIARRGELEVFTATPLTPQLSRLITDYKDSGVTALTCTLARLASVCLNTAIAVHEPQEIGWIPSNAKARRRRGFDPNYQILRRCLIERRKVGLSTPKLTQVLSFARDSEDQAGLGVAERIENTRDVFKALPIGHSLLLFDDILTTGATLQAATTALFRAGNNVVGLVVMAETLLRMPPYDESRIGKVD